MCNTADQKEKKIRTNPVKVIKDHCLDCMGGSWDEVKKCTAEKSCKLWPFRTGKNPHRPKRILTEEEKQVIRDRFAKTTSSITTKS